MKETVWYHRIKGSQLKSVIYFSSSQTQYCYFHSECLHLGGKQWKYQVDIPLTTVALCSGAGGELFPFSSAKRSWLLPEEKAVRQEGLAFGDAAWLHGSCHSDWDRLCNVTDSTSCFNNKTKQKTTKVAKMKECRPEQCDIVVWVRRLKSGLCLSILSLQGADPKHFIFSGEMFALFFPQVVFSTGGPLFLFCYTVLGKLRPRPPPGPWDVSADHTTSVNLWNSLLQDAIVHTDLG